MSLSWCLPCSSDTNLFLIHHANGVIPNAVQDAPLALITKPRSHSSTPSAKPLSASASPPCPVAVNLKTCAKEMPGSFGSVLKSSAPSGVAHTSRKTPRSLCAGKSLGKTNSARAPVRSSESHSSKDSDDSFGDDLDEDDEDNDDLEDEDSGSSLTGQIKP